MVGWHKNDKKISWSGWHKNEEMVKKNGEKMVGKNGEKNGKKNGEKNGEKKSHGRDGTKMIKNIMVGVAQK